MANFSLLAKLGLDTKAFQTGLKRSSRGVQNFSKGAIRSFQNVAAAFLGIQGAKKIIELGTAAEETASKFRAVFGTAADEMSKKIEKLKDTIPATTAELQDITATLATMTQAMGLPTEASNQLSIQLTELGADIASFNNMKPEEVFTKMRAAISGEFEPLKQLGVVINEARLQNKALELGVEKVGKSFTAAQKSILVYNILLDDTQKMQGDAAATSESTANKIKFLQRDLAELATSLGEFVIPQIQAFVTGVNMISGAIGGVINKVKEMTTSNKDAGDSFEQMARQNLEASGQLETVGRTGGVAAIARNEEKIKQRARELRAAHQALSDGEKELFDNIMNSGKATDATNKTREEARKQYELNLQKINEMIAALGELDDIEGDGGDGDENEKFKMQKAGGITSLAAIGGGGRVGSLAKIPESQLKEAEKQTKVLEKIEKNTKAPTTPTAFK